jgi:PII-like signaling protein
MSRLLSGRVRTLQIFISEDDHWGNEPLHQVLVQKLRLAGIAGVTVFRGTAGFGSQRKIHEAGRLGASADLPVFVMVIDTPERIDAVLPIIDELVSDGLVIRSDGEVVKHADSR